METKSSWASRINWVAVGGAVVALLVAFGVDVSEEVRTAILTAVPVVGGGVIWVLRTWFTKKLTKASVE